MEIKFILNVKTRISNSIFSIIQERPDFPFTYYVIALCYKKQGREEWKQYAQKAILILEKTTQIDGHHGFHDEALSQLLLLVRE